MKQPAIKHASNVRHDAHNTSARRARHALPAILTAALAALLATAWPSNSVPQLDVKGDTVAVMANGHVVLCVADHAIIVAAIGGGGVSGSRQPAIVPIGASYVGVLLGTVEWDTPNSKTKPIRLDVNLPAAVAGAARRVEHPEPNEPSDIEKIGVATLEQIRPLVGKIHDKLSLAPDQPLFELILADYTYDYGPEVWALEYRAQQEDLGNDYWLTRPMRPAYHQLYPPDKGHPHTLMEVQYPKNAGSGLLDLIERHDPALDPIGTASPEMGAAMGAIQEGNTQKAATTPLANFLRAAIPAVYGGKSRLSMALLDDRRGFQWLLAPEDPLPPPDPTKPADPGAPTLRKYTPPQ
jgi:hypothetical protein